MRILVGSIPVVGHINPLVPIVRALCAHGHEVRWYTGAKYRFKVEATGARFVGRAHARDYDDAQIGREFPDRTKLRGIAGINLKTATPKPEQVRGAVNALLHESRYRERARALAAEYTRYDAVTLAVGTIGLIAR